MRRLGFAFIFAITCFIGTYSVPAHALSSDQKLFISADNTFYAYVKAGESVGAQFRRVDQNEPFDTVRGDVTITVDGPGVAQQSCVAKRDVAFGQGCDFAAQTAPKSGIWRVQFSVPADAKTYYEVSPTVKWAKNLFSWSISIKGLDGSEQKGRIWTERYAIRQPADVRYADDLIYYYISEDGYIYRATEFGYNGQISTLSADSIGIRSGTGCVSAYESVDVGNAKFSPALGACGNAYKLFFEEPAGDLPAKATKWDDTQDWIRPNISRPSVGGLKFTSDNSTDQQSGTISFTLRNFIGQYQVKIDIDNDGSFDGQSDVVINQQMKKLSDGTQQVKFGGVDRQGQIILPSQAIGIKVEITKVAEIHLVAADVEGREGGLELLRLNGDNAPTSRLCWNDTELGLLADEKLLTKLIDGRSCPDSTDGVHGWTYADQSWGNARYIDDWSYAFAKLSGTNQITYPDAAATVATTQRNWLAVILAGVGVLVGITIVGVIIVVRIRKKKQAAQIVPPQPPITPGVTISSEDTPPENRQGL